MEVKQYQTLLNNVVPIAKKEEKIRICVHYRDLNKASPKDIFLLQNIHVLINNSATNEIESFADCYASYHLILMDDEDIENTNFISPWSLYHHGEMSFCLKNMSVA